MITSTRRTVVGIVAGAAALATAGVGMATSASAASYTGKVTGQQGVNARQAPTTHSSFKGTIAKGQQIRIACKINGTKVGDNALWYKLSDSRWVSARYVANVGSVPTPCPEIATDTALGLITGTVNKRSAPSTADTRTGSYGKGNKVWFRCQVTGQSIDGNNRWYLTADGKTWVSARYVKNINGGPSTRLTPVPC